MTYVVCECKIGIDWGLSWSPTPFVVKHVAPSGMRGAEPICLLHTHVEYLLDSGLGRYM